MNHKVADVQVGMKRVELRAITTNILMPSTADGPCPAVNLDGTQWFIDNMVRKVGFEAGDRVTLFWCARDGAESNWAAGYNHRTGKFGIAPHGLNELIAPPLYSTMGPIAIFVGLFALFAVFQGSAAAFLLLLVCILPFVVIYSRQKQVRRAMESALAEIKRQESATPAAAGSGGVHI